MSLFGNKPKTAQQKAQWAKTRVMIRGVALVYVVFYVIVPMFNMDIEEAESMHPALRYSVIAFFILVCTALIISTIVEFLRGQKDGRYKAEAYTDDEGAGSAAATESASEDNDEKEDDVDEDDYYEDDDDEDEDYDDEDDYDDDDYDEDDEDDEDGENE